MNIDISIYKGDFSQAYLLSYMVHPLNIERRQLFAQYRFTKEALVIGASIPSDNSLVPSLIRAIDEGVGGDLEKAKKGGYASGLVLLMLINMARRKEEFPDGGMDKACHLVSELWESHMRSKENKDPKVSHSAVRKFWKEYKSVAHLWAALILLKNEMRNENFPMGGGRRLANLAHTLKLETKKYSLPRKHGSFLPDNSLEIIGAAQLETLSVDFLKDCEFISNSLVNFKSRYRYE